MSMKGQRTLAYIVLIIISFFCLFWFYVLFINATRSNGALKKGFTAIPGGFLIKNWKSLLAGTLPVWKGMFNSIFIATCSAVLCTYFSTMTAYAIHAYDFKGKKLILYFYPKDNTSGCTAEACSLNDSYSSLTEKGFEVVGVSPDSANSHLKFIAKYNLAFNLIADTEKKILEAYGVWAEKKLYGRTYMGVVRTTFIINANGIIERIITKVNTKDHAKQILE